MTVSDESPDPVEGRPPPSVSAETYDPLLLSLQKVAAWHGVRFNPADAVSGLPLKDGQLTPSLLLRAAERAGFRAKMVKRPLRKIPIPLLPAILILKGNRAGVLEPDEQDDACFHEAGEVDPVNWKRLTARSLKEDYAGYAILLRPTLSSGSFKESVIPEMEEKSGASRWFWGTIWKFRRELLRLLPASVLVNLFALCMPLFIMTVYDRVVPNEAMETLWVLAVGAVTVFSFEYLMRLLRGQLLHRTGKKLDGVLASALFDHLMAIEMKARPLSAGLLANKARAYEAIREFITSASLVALVDVPFSLLMIGAIFYLAGNVGWIPLGAASFSLIFGLFMQVPLRRAVREAFMGSLERQAFLSETIRGIESVKGSNAQGAFQRRMENMIRDASDKEVSSHWYSLLGTSTTTWILHLTTIAVVVGCVWQVSLGKMTLGGVVACVILTSRAMTPLSLVSGLMTRFQQSLASLRGINQLMEMPREYGGGRLFTARRRMRPRFSVESITFRYPDQELPAIDNVSLTINPGERVAVIGRVGSGKSTLLRVLGKLYEPDEGQIMLDGLELPQYHPVELRSQIGYLPQDVSIFHGTLRENVALGMPWISDADVLQATELACLGDFINHQPEGIHLQVGEQGSRLSGGQRESIALARAVLLRPTLLLLDEPTANMDVNTEQMVLANLRAYLDEDPDRTLVLSTHKLHLLELADRVVVLDRGRIVADGPRQEVLNQLRNNHSHQASREAIGGTTDGDTVEAKAELEN